MRSLREFGAAYVEPLAAGLASLAVRAVVRIVTESTKVRTVQTTQRAGDPPSDDVRHAEPLGLTSRPVVGAEAYILRIGASADHEVAIVVWDTRVRPVDQDEGETGLYDSGPALAVPTTQQRVRLRPGVGIEVAAPYGMEVQTGTLYGAGGFSAPVLGAPAPGRTGTFTDVPSGNTLIFSGGILVGGTGIP